MPIEVLMPPLSQTLDTLVLVEWLKREGDEVRKGEPLFLVESDKATLEVEAPAAGVVRTLLARAGDEVKIKTPVALIAAPGEASPTGMPAGAQAHAAAAPNVVLAELPAADRVPARAQRIAASPRARARAEREGVALATLRPTGPQGMIVERDVLAFLAAGQVRPRVSPVAQRVAAAAGVDLAAVAEAQPGRRIVRADVESALEADARPGDELEEAPDLISDAGLYPAAPGAEPLPGGAIVRLSPLRRVSAGRLQAAHQVVVPVTLTREVDATELVALRERILQDLGPDDVRPTFTDFFALSAARCLLKHRGLNGVFDGEFLTTYETVHLALAVDTPRGLVAPVLQGAERAGLLELARRRARLAAAALAGRLAPEELAGGTFTLTNLGPLRVDAFTPVVNPPQIAILGIGRIRPIPAVYEGQIALRQVVVLSLTFDHRATDGAPAARFLDEVAQFVEKPHRIWY